jgi:hypothetical protein
VFTHDLGDGARPVPDRGDQRRDVVYAADKDRADQIQASAGAQPNITPAKMGPTMGPAAAMAEKCWPIKNLGSMARNLRRRARPRRAWAHRGRGAAAVPTGCRTPVGDGQHNGGSEHDNEQTHEKFSKI